MIDAGNRTDIAVIDCSGIILCFQVVSHQVGKHLVVKQFLLLPGKRMIFRKVLLAVCDAVQKIDRYRLIYALVLSHAKQLMLECHQHKTAGKHHRRNPVGTHVP